MSNNQPNQKMSLNHAELQSALGKLITLIEECGASTALTNAVILASDIRQAVGNDWTADRVRAATPETAPTGSAGSEGLPPATPAADLLGVPVWNPLDDGIKGRPLMVSAYDYNRAVSKVEALEAALEKLKKYSVGTLDDGVKGLSYRIKALEAALESLKQYTVCNCPEDEETGRVRYHSNCHRHGRKIIDDALEPESEAEWLDKVYAKPPTH